MTVKRRHWDSSAWQDLGEADPENPVTMIKFVWPGGYPVAYVDPEDDSEALCVDTVIDMLRKGEWPSETVDSFTHYEGPALECTCGALIKSAYGDPGEER